MTRRFSDEEIKEAFAHTARLGNITHASALCGVGVTTIRSWLRDDELVERLYPKDGLPPPIKSRIAEADVEIVEKSVQLSRDKQRLMDSNRIERKSFREHGRAVNMIEDLTESLIEVFKERKFNINTVKHVIPNAEAPIGVIQLSDLHMNMVIDELADNKFNLDVACQRIYKHVALSINKFVAEDVSKVVLALTGDLVKNIQHLSEISQNSMSRANCTFIIVDIIAQVIKHLNQEGFNVTVASVVGNESRAMEHIHETDFLASDSFDLMIHKMLQYILKDAEGVTVLPMTNMFECVLQLHKTNLLLVHGHAHGRLAGTATIEKHNDSLVARYSTLGVKIDYMICGHIHQAYISDKYARSGGLPGTDEYAARKLNLFGRASQNAYMIYADGSIDGYKHDLQNTAGWESYRFDKVSADLSIENRVRSGRMEGNVVLSINGNAPFASYTV